MGAVRGHIEVRDVWSRHRGHLLQHEDGGRNHGEEACANGRGIPVREVEPAVWEFVCSLLKDPDT
jgi:hypothetical protein